MAVEDKYTDSKIVAGKLGNPALISGASVLEFVASFEVDALDDDASVFRIGRSITGSLIPIEITVLNDGITGATDWDLGLYRPGLGAVISKDVLGDGLDLSAARVIGAGITGLSNLVIEDLGSKLYELAGHTISNKLDSYDLALTANVAGSASGTVTVICRFIEG
jgi:hypothetical protein